MDITGLSIDVPVKRGVKTTYNLTATVKEYIDIQSVTVSTYLLGIRAD